MGKKGIYGEKGQLARRADERVASASEIGIGPDA